MTERIGNNVSDDMIDTEFSSLSGLQINQFQQNLKSGNLNSKEYLDVAHLRLESVEYREWYNGGFLEGLRFNWSNGVSS